MVYVGRGKGGSMWFMWEGVKEGVCIFMFWKHHIFYKHKIQTIQFVLDQCF